jgi:hypothetical protein
MKETIVRLQRAGMLEVVSVSHITEEEKENGVKSLLQKFSIWRLGRKKELVDDGYDSSDSDSGTRDARTFPSRRIEPRDAIPLGMTLDQIAAGPAEPIILRVHSVSQTRSSSASGSLPAHAPRDNKLDSRMGSLIAGADQSASPDVSNLQDDNDGAQEVEASTNLYLTNNESTADTSIALEDGDGGCEAGPSHLISKDATTGDVIQGGKEGLSSPLFVDVAVQTLAEEHGSKGHQPGTKSPEASAAVLGPPVNTRTNFDPSDH